jgi:hypothetical protein
MKAPAVLVKTLLSLIQDRMLLMPKMLPCRSGRVLPILGLGLVLSLSISLISEAARTSGTASPANAPQYQLLANPGMEVYDPPYGRFERVPCQVASGWQRFWYGGPEPCWMDTRVFAGSHLGGGWVERIEGATSQLIISTEPYTAGLRQRVTGLTPGMGYGFHAAMLTIYQTSAPPSVDGTMIKQVGIDPTGGLDPRASTVVWSEPDDHDEGPWDIDQRTAVYAQGPAMTVFVRVISPLPSGSLPFLNYSFLDSAILAQTPQVRATSPAVSDALTFTVRWDNAVPAPGGGRLRWYDVQWLDQAEGVWHDWQEQTQATEASFTGNRGHTYRFRARAWQRYPNGAHLYGPYRPGGDTSTRIAGPRLAGRVLTNAGNPVSGAIVAISGTTYTTRSGSDGSYVLDVEPGTAPQTATVSHAWWASPDPRHGLTFGPTETVPFTWTLRPPGDVVANGGFESGLEGWTPSGTGTGEAVPVADPVHTGQRALALTGQSASLNAAEGVMQTVTLSGAWEPVLSLWYRPGPTAGDPGAAFTVRLTADGADDRRWPAVATTEVLTPSLAASGWQHLGHYVGPPGTAYTGTVTVHFQVRGGGGQALPVVYLDEVSFGAGPGGPKRLFLPLARREVVD